MPTETEAKRCWEGSNVRGEFSAYLLPIMTRYQESRVRLNKFLSRKVLTPKEWAQLQFLQGQMHALQSLILFLEGYAKPTTEHASPKRRKVEE